MLSSTLLILTIISGDFVMPSSAKLFTIILGLLPFNKINCDGSANGNPGKAGLGVVARNPFGVVVGVLTKGLGITFSYYAECEAIIEVLSWAVIKGWLKLWIESDPLTALLVDPTPIPVKPIFQGLTIVEAEETSEDYFWLHQFYYMIRAETDHENYRRGMVERIVEDEDNASALGQKRSHKCHCIG
ncbi:hypothetical protein GIB67_020820 [Kingdonia uniflora]|uniref:RNase H type-1 domain-containing protein n=1 Tax=Kingdonia uniflora TaxID=39325 RepID=A0A7J7M776_9MAGN|nr:hypothetical protein GIB67_020820 [Kingdonia uniflora]